MEVNTPRWAGVPFIFKAGKSLNERKAEVRIQFKSAPASEFMFGVECPRNELVIRLQPKEEIYIKTNVKTPGFSSAPIQSELAVEYISHFGRNLRTPDAYSRLILDVLRGRSAGFVRSDELEEVRTHRGRSTAPPPPPPSPLPHPILAITLASLFDSLGESSRRSCTTSSRRGSSQRSTNRGRGGRPTTRRSRSGGTGGTRNTFTLTGRLC